MAGNVWEWTSSAYADYPYEPKDGQEDPESSKLRVLRGGSFGYTAYGVRCAFRDYGGTDVGSGVGGFRVVVSPGL